MAGSDDDLLGTIQSSLDATGVWVDPSLSALITARDVKAMEAHVADSATPLFVVVQPLSDGDSFGGDPVELLSRLHDRSHADGLYVAVRSPDSPEYFGLTTRAWGSVPDDYYAASVGEQQHPGDLAGALVQVTRLVADGGSEEAYLALHKDQEATSTPPPPPAEDDGGSALPVGILVGVTVALAACAAAWRVHHARRRTFSLPASVIERVREAHDDKLEQRAAAEVLALGEAIDAAEMLAADEPTAWQAALDHYDGAQRVLARGGGRPEVLDVVGAIVLAGRGQEALRAAKGRRPFRPSPVCYLNPLHAQPRGTSTVESAGRRVEVPMCGVCRADLRAQRAPDVLDIVRRGRPVHYFETDAEPWASTGYGALEPDLVPRLQGRR